MELKTTALKIGENRMWFLHENGGSCINSLTDIRQKMFDVGDIDRLNDDKEPRMIGSDQIHYQYDAVR